MVSEVSTGRRFLSLALFKSGGSPRLSRRPSSGRRPSPSTVDTETFKLSSVPQPATRGELVKKDFTVKKPKKEQHVRASLFFRFTTNSPRNENARQWGASVILVRG